MIRSSRAWYKVLYADRFYIRATLSSLLTTACSLQYEQTKGIHSVPYTYTELSVLHCPFTQLVLHFPVESESRIIYQKLLIHSSIVYYAKAAIKNKTARKK